MINKLELHIIQNFAPSCLNRDVTGAPKDVVFGGALRLRISSQCLKRAIRLEAQGLLNDKMQSAIRSGIFHKEISRKLKEEGRDEKDANKVGTACLKALGINMDDKKDKSGYLLYLGENQLNEIVNVAINQWSNILKAENENEKKKGKEKEKYPSEISKSLKDAINKSSAEVLMYGRMMANDPSLSVEACCQVAHAISTHKTNREFDFWAAVDDLQPDEESGAGMIGTAEFSSACMYRYSVVDVTKLSDEKSAGKETAKDMIQAFIHASVNAIPTGKQNSFAAHNPPDLILIALRGKSPRNLCNAFEKPVRCKANDEKSISALSAKALLEYEIKLEQAYGGDSQYGLLDLTDSGVSLPNTKKSPTVKDLAEWAMAQLD